MFFKICDYEGLPSGSKAAYYGYQFYMLLTAKRIFLQLNFLVT